MIRAINAEMKMLFPAQQSVIYYADHKIVSSMQINMVDGFNTTLFEMGISTVTDYEHIPSQLYFNRAFEIHDNWLTFPNDHSDFATLIILAWWIMPHELWEY